MTVVRQRERESVATTLRRPRHISRRNELLESCRSRRRAWAGANCARKLYRTRARARASCLLSLRQTRSSSAEIFPERTKLSDTVCAPYVRSENSFVNSRGCDSSAGRDARVTNVRGSPLPPPSSFPLRRVDIARGTDGVDAPHYLRRSCSPVSRCARGLFFSKQICPLIGRPPLILAKESNLRAARSAAGISRYTLRSSPSEIAAGLRLYPNKFVYGKARQTRARKSEREGGKRRDGGEGRGCIVDSFPRM